MKLDCVREFGSDNNFALDLHRWSLFLHDIGLDLGRHSYPLLTAQILATEEQQHRLSARHTEPYSCEPPYVISQVGNA